jgi:transcriptional regulator with XRE-family HTH domain
VKTGEALKRIRMFYGLLQVQLAASLDISRSHLCEMESGKKRVSLEMIYKFAEVTRIRPSSIIRLAEIIDSAELPTKEINKEIAKIIEVD